MKLMLKVWVNAMKVSVNEMKVLVNEMKVLVNEMKVLVNEKDYNKGCFDACDDLIWPKIKLSFFFQ
jgi:hypothetical protein